ncbi:MAG: hypothetical protein JO273_14385 [Methylobacteriaceae bacterium]|nr:hypothetical protein [Methylobacteriaceae bacterium]
MAIAIGIIGEVAFGMWDSRIQTELRSRSNDKLGAAEKEAGEANDRAAQALKEAAEARIRAISAELELAKYRDWRRLDDAGFSSVVDAMLSFAGTPFTLAVSPIEPETTELLFRIRDALKAAGLEHQGWPQSNIIRFAEGDDAVTVGIGKGVNVRDVTITWEFSEAPTFARVGQTLSTALNAAGITAGAWGERQMPMLRPNPTLRVMVGRKM